MSDFDKEAEREKLRERFEAEDDKREATEQMSELLLKGATMTNAHCTDCGDPVFRYDGQEFCPTCQKPVARDQSGADDEDESSDEQIEVADPSDDARVQFGGDDGTNAAAQQADEQQNTARADAAAQDQNATGPGTDAQNRNAAGAGADASLQDTAGAADAPADGTQPTSGDRRRGPDETKGEGQLGHSANATGRANVPHSESTTQQSTVDRRASSSQPTPSVSGGTTGSGIPQGAADDLAEATTLLAQTVRRYAELARDAETPRESREYLQAAREAAEALDAATF